MKPYVKVMDEMKNQKQQGFTLVELIVSLLLIGILMAFAVPSFSSFIRSQRISNDTNDMLADLSFTRVAALNSGLDVIIEPISGNDWHLGWRIYSDINGNDAFDESGDELLRVTDLEESSLQITGPGFIGFNNQGALEPSEVKTLLITHKNAPEAKLITVSLSGLVNSKTKSVSL